MDEVVQKGDGMTEEVKKVKGTLDLLMEASEKGVRSLLLEIMQMAEGVEREILECALDQEKLKEWFPEGILLGRHLIDDSLRLRHERDQHWSWIICGRADNEAVEIYNYLQLVQIPKMAFRVLEAMSTKSTMVLAALTDEQYAAYEELGDLARKVLEHSLATLGGERTAMLMKVGLPVLQESLKKPQKI